MITVAMITMMMTAQLPLTVPERRIVSLAPTITETLFDLGVGREVVGVTNFCDRPIAATALPKVGGYTDVSLEAILALRPTLVIGLRGPDSLHHRLTEQGVAILIVATDTLSDVITTTIAIGTAVHRLPQAQQLVATIAAPQTATASQQVMIIVGTSPFVVAGPSTFSADVLRRGWPSARVVPTSVAAWPELSLESIASFGPGLIVIIADGPSHEKRVRSALAQLPMPPRVVVLPRAALVRPSVTSVVEDIALLRQTPMPP